MGRIQFIKFNALTKDAASGNLPDKAVIFIRVYKAPYGITGECDENRVLTLTKQNRKNLVLKSLEEVNAKLPEDKQLLKYDFYALTSDIGSDGGGAISFGDLGAATGGFSSPTPKTPKPTNDNAAPPESVAMPTPESVTSPTPEDSGMSFDTIAGIAVVVVVIVIALILKSKGAKKND